MLLLLWLYTRTMRHYCNADFKDTNKFLLGHFYKLKAKHKHLIDDKQTIFDTQRKNLTMLKAYFIRHLLPSSQLIIFSLQCLKTETAVCPDGFSHF